MSKSKKIKAQACAQTSLGNEFIDELLKNEYFSGKEIRMNDNPSEIMSQIILDFARPFLNDCKTDIERKRTISIYIMIWNISLMPRELRKAEIKKMIDIIAGDDNDDYMFWSSLIKAEMFRKEMNFSQVSRFICNYKIDKRENELRLSIVSVPIE